MEKKFSFLFTENILIELQVDKMLNEENEKFKTEQLQSYKRDIEAETVVTDETIAVEVH